MSKCSENFKKIFGTLDRKTDAFSPFFSDDTQSYNEDGVVINADEILDNVEEAIDNIAEQAITMSEASDISISTYNFNGAKEKLIQLRKKYGFLSDNVINNILDSIKLKLKNDIYNINPIVEENPLFDFSSLSELLGGIDSMEKYLELELESGLFKSMFINNINDNNPDYSESEDYEPFVVTDMALNNNLNVYKNRLWIYISKTSKVKDADGTRLYIDGVLNKDLFLPRNNKPSIYAEVLLNVKQDMQERLKNAESYKQIKIHGKAQYSPAQAYVKALILSNFDNFVLAKHANVVSVNLDGVNTFLPPTNGKSKYKLMFKWSKAINIDNSERASSIDKNTSSLVQMLSNVIPYYEKVRHKGKDRWIVSKELTLGKSNLDSIGAVINSLDPNFTFTLNYNDLKGRRVVGTVSIGEAFDLYDKGIIDFNIILNGLLESSKRNDDLFSRESVIKSVERFLYSERNGLVRNLKLWKDENPDLADLIINPEIALINHIRNTVKNVYRKETLKDNGKTIDALNIETTVGQDFSELLNNLQKAWKNKNVNPKDINEITDYDSFFNFLSNSKKGGMFLSEQVKNNFIENFPIDFESEGFKINMKKLLSQKASGLKTEVDDTGLGHTVLNIENITDLLKTKDVNDHLRLIELFRLKHYSSKYNILTQVNDFSGNALPTMGIANLASLFVTSLTKDPSNFFSKNPELYKGTEILLEVEGKDTSVYVDELNSDELFKFAFIRNYVMSSINEDKMIIQPWNFSDKPKIFGIAVNTNGTLNGEKSIKDFTSLELQDRFYTEQQSYYNKLLSNVLDDFRRLDSKFFSNWQKSNKMSSPIERLNAIEKYLDGIESKADLAKKVQEVFKDGKYTEITEDLHYSVYGKKIKFNQFLKGNILIFNNKNYFNEFVKRKEQNLLEALPEIKLSEITLNNGYVSKKNKISKLATLFGIEEDQLLEENENTLTSSINGKLSEPFSKYLWSRNLIISQYANLTTKDSFLHPSKLKTFNSLDLNNEEGWNQYIEEENVRSVTFTKRMNIPGASMTIYGKGKHGISQNIKIAAIYDPSEQTYNYTGESWDQDVYDGGTQTNPFFNELLIWSLPGLDLKRTQKPIGESITDKSAAMLKFATFAVNNEEVRKSMFAPRSSYTTMKKMNSLNIYNTDSEGNPIYVDITKVVDKKADSYSIIDVSTIQDNLWIPVDGEYFKLNNFQWIEGTNTYKLSLEGRAEANIVTINNLFDLWEAFGGAVSKNKIGNKLVYSEDSINLVSSIIKQHSLVNSDLKLKDRMIAMLSPRSAIKKGVSNLNTADGVYGEDPISYFNFDTSFFGVQLTAFHSTENSTTNEITQVISAISENATTPELYNNVYDAISTLIENGLSKFKLNIQTEDGVERIVKSFIKNINNSSQINNSRAIINGITTEINKEIPLGNKTIYKQFVSYIVSNINMDFIRRKFSGSGSILNPSHGIVQVFEDKNGKTYFSEDLLNLYDGSLEVDPTLSEFDKIKLKVNHVLSLSDNFTPEPISKEEIQPLDFINLNIDIIIKGETKQAGETISLVEIDDFFLIKGLIDTYIEQGSEVIVNRVFNQSRDLRPVLIDFKTNEGKQSVYNTDAAKFNWWVEFNKNQLKENNLQSENVMFNQFKQFVYKIDPFTKELGIAEQYDVIRQYAGRWMGRTFDMLADKKLFSTYASTIARIDEGVNPFDIILGYKEEGSDKIFIDNFTSKYEKGRTYSSQQEVLEYNHKKAENIHTNVFKDNFSLGNTAHADINKDFFYNKLKDFANTTPGSKTPYDISFGDSNTDEYLYVAIENNKYYELNNKLYDKLSNEEVGTKIYINEEVSPNGDKVRLSSYGAKLYTLPVNYSMFKDNNGNEILLIKESEELSSLDNYRSFINKKDSHNVIKFNDFSDYQENILGVAENDKLLNLIKATISSTHDKHLRRYLTEKRNSYIVFRNSGQTEETIKTEYKKYLKTEDVKNLRRYISKMSAVMYESWKHANISLSARIPAQALQSFMSMNTIGYLTGEANDIYVSHWQLWLQGSDYDIDKLYMMMYDFKNGSFQGWSPFFDVLKFEQSSKIPLPDSRYFGIINSETSEIKIKTSKSIVNDVKVTTEITPNNDNTVDLDAIIDPEDSMFNNRIKILQALKNKPNAEYIKSTNVRLMESINYHNSYMSEAGFKNYIVNNLINVSDHPSNQISSYTPISFGVYEKIKKQLGDKYKLGLYDGHTMFKQQEQNSVGKKVIGIAATGLKDYFGLVKYFADFYENVDEIDTTSSKYFLREFTLNGKTFIKSKISGINLKKKANSLLKENLTEMLNKEAYKNKFTGEDLTVDQINEIIEQIVAIKPDQDAALTISSILSLATDNAKELMLSKINAGIDFASMHIYLAILGVDTEEVARFMTNPEVDKIKDKISRDFFKDGKDVSAISKLNKIDPKKAGIDEDFFNEFMKINTYSSELTSLGSFFKVNQGSKASQEDLYKLSNGLSSIFSTQDNIYFSTFNYIEANPGDEISQKVNFIINEKPYLSGKEQYITKVLLSMESESKEVDVYKYFTDADYKNKIKEYYNLIKYTFNVFDVLEDLPHFNSMYKAFIEGEKFLLDNVNKYKTVKETAPNIIELGISKNELDLFDIIKDTKLMSNKDNPTMLSNKVIAKVNEYYDYRIISNFIRRLDYKLDISRLMDYLSITFINLLKNDKQAIKENEYNKDNLPYTFIDLSSEFGIAQFRYLMENYIIPHEKNKHKSNGFLKQYTYNKDKNFNLKHKLSYYLDKSNFPELENIEIGMSLLINDSSNKTEESYTDPDNNSIGSNYDIPVKLNSDNNVENFKLIDLLTLYDLLVNEGKYGGNRATIFFAKDIKNNNSIARKFVNFQTRNDLNKELSAEIENELRSDLNKRQIFYLKVFGQISPDKEILSAQLTDGHTINVNKYFTILGNIENASVNIEAETLSKSIVSLMKSKNINIQTECK